MAVKALERVDLSTDVYFVCLSHAMCTEMEEIVGLLVGEVDEIKVAHVSAVVILRRSDKRKDRVEISPEQLSSASTEAEKIACILKKPVRIVGWYHSHPKLTVYPSIVDVCTQESYQFMDQGFIGIIFSVFNADPNKFGGRIQMICYQSQNVVTDCGVEKSHLEIPIQLVPSSNISSVCMNTLVQLPRFLCQEEQLAYQMANQIPLDYLTRLHNNSVYLRKMGQIAEVISGPLLKMLEERILNNEMKRKKLQDRKKELMSMVEKAKAQKAQIEKERSERTKRKAEKLKNRKEISETVENKQKALNEFEEQELKAAVPRDRESQANIVPIQKNQPTVSVKTDKKGVVHVDETNSQRQMFVVQQGDMLSGDIQSVELEIQETVEQTPSTSKTPPEKRELSSLKESSQAKSVKEGSQRIEIPLETLFSPKKKNLQKES